MTFFFVIGAESKQVPETVPKLKAGSWSTKTYCTIINSYRMPQILES